MVFTASQIAGILEGEVEGNPEIAVHKLAKIEEGEKGSLTFLANPKYTPFIYTTKASITIVNKDFTPEQHLATTLIKVEDAYESFSKLLEYYDQVKNTKTGIEQPVFLSESTVYGEGLYLGAFAYIAENVVMGKNVKIYPNPSSNRQIFIDVPEEIFGNFQIKITTINGDIVQKETASITAKSFGISTNKLVSGNYFITLSGEKGIVITKRFVISK